MNEIENRIERSRTRFIASALVRGSVVCTKSFIDPETGKLVEAGKSWWHTSAIPPQLRDHFGRSDEEVVATLNRRDRRDEVATARSSNPQPKRGRGLYGLDFGRGSETSHREPADSSGDAPASLRRLDRG
jgi:hypothetical protein